MGSGSGVVEAGVVRRDPGYVDADAWCAGIYDVDDNLACAVRDIVADTHTM